MNTREIILSKASELYQRYGIKSITMDDLAREIGISKKTLYKEFRNKEHIISEILNNIQQKLCYAFEERQGEKVNPIEEIYLISYEAYELLNSVSHNTIYDLRKYYGLVFNQFNQEFFKKIFEGVKENLSKGIKQGFYRENLDISFTAEIYIFRSEYILNEDWFDSESYSMFTIFWESLDLFMRGICTQNGLDKWNELKLENLKG